MAGPRKYRGAEVKVGIFVALGILLFIVFIVLISGSRWGQRVDVYRVRFKNVAGLDVGSPVRLAGLRVGRVEEIGVARDDPSLMEAVVHLKSGTPIREGVRAYITAIGLTGEMYLELSLGNRDAPLLPPGSSLQGEEATSFQQLLNEWSGISSNTGLILEELGKSLALLVRKSTELADGLDRSLKNITGSAEELVGNLDETFDERRRREIQSIISGMQETVQETNEFMKRLNLVLDDKNREEFAALLMGSNRLLTNLDREMTPTLAQVREGIKNLDRETTTTLEQLRERAGTLDQEMTATLKQLRERAEKLEGGANRNLEVLAADLKRTSQAYRRLAFRADRLIKGSTDDARELISNFLKASDRMNGLLVELGKVVPKEGEVEKTLRSFRQTLEQARVLAARIDQTVEGNREDIAIIIQNIREASQNLSEFSRTLREQPSSIILTPSVRRKEIPGE